MRNYFQDKFWDKIEGWNLRPKIHGQGSWGKSQLKLGYNSGSGNRVKLDSNSGQHLDLPKKLKKLLICMHFLGGG